MPQRIARTMPTEGDTKDTIAADAIGTASGTTNKPPPNQRIHAEGVPRSGVIAYPFFRPLESLVVMRSPAMRSVASAAPTTK